MSDPKKIVRLVDFAAIEAQAAEWVARLDAEPNSAELHAQFEAWKALSHHHGEAAARLAGLWTELDMLSQLTPPITATVPSPRRSRKTPGPSARALSPLGANRVMLRAGLAACLVIMAGFGVWGVWANSPRTEVYDTAVGGQRTVNLSDGSSVQLNTNSRVEVRYSPSSRDLRLVKGEAFFEVAPNKSRPFSVYARDGVVRAVGTAFVVRLQPKGIEVTVTKGTVELAGLTSTKPVSSLSRARALPRHVLTTVTADKGTTESAVLAPSHQVEKLDLAPPEATRKLAWRQGMLVFTGESLPSVVADVSRYTDVQIEIADPELNNLKVGGYFKVGEVEPMLEALEGSFGVRVERLDAKHVRLSARL